MDKRTVIQAYAGTGKTQKIIDLLDTSSRFLIITFTENNYANLKNRISKKYNGEPSANIKIMTYYKFLYEFCYKPFCSDHIRAKGISFSEEDRPNKYSQSGSNSYYFNANRKFYKSRLSKFILDKTIDDVIMRLNTFFDYLIIDECQDMDSWDLDLITNFSKSNLSLLYVGDFYQHTYSTSHDGNKNLNLYSDLTKYKEKYEKSGFTFDDVTLSKSWRCSTKICEFIFQKLGIKISAQKDNAKEIEFIEDTEKAIELWNNEKIAKFHYNKGKTYGHNHFNWGEVKGIDDFEDVCVLLNDSTFKSYNSNTLNNLHATTKNKLYVAITRAHGNVYLLEEKKIKGLIGTKNDVE